MQHLKWILIFPILLGLLNADEVLVNTQDGHTYTFEIDPAESVGMLQERISALTDEEAYIVAIPSRKKTWLPKAGKQGGYLGHPRDYARPVTQQERDDIHFIITSLADKSLITIAFIKADLEAAGDRIDHIHPLRFLITVFLDEEMKVAIRNIRARGWIWGQFIGGVKDCLATEAQIGNIRDDYIAHFANTVELNVNKLIPAFQTQNWDHLIDTLIKEIPRKGDHDRYEN